MIGLKIKPMESKFWDMDISLKELLDSNDDCYFKRDYNPGSKHIGGYLYLKHPKIGDKYSIMIGLNSDGFVYYADSSPCPELELENLDDALHELMLYYHFNEIRLNNLNKKDIKYTTPDKL